MHESGSLPNSCIPHNPITLSSVPVYLAILAEAHSCVGGFPSGGRAARRVRFRTFLGVGVVRLGALSGWASREAP